MELDHGGAQARYGFHAVQHHVKILPGEPQDHMDTGVDPWRRLLQASVALHKLRKVVSSVDHGSRFIVRRLEAQFHGQDRSLCQVSQIIHGFGWKAVCAGGNIQPYHPLKSQDLLELFPQNVHGCVGVGTRLKIGDTTLRRPLP